jgi:hypothetical protein
MKILLLTFVGIMVLPPQATFSQGRMRSIRWVDFANFTYPRVANPAESLVLRNGQERTNVTPRSLEDVSYGDVTGDGVEEAIVILGVLTGGSAMPNEVYIYRMRRSRPVLLWSFTTGDRADGGLRAIYADRGRLVVELNGPKRGIEEGDCCPKRLTRTHYVWRGGRFQRQRQQTLPLAESG